MADNVAVYSNGQLYGSNGAESNKNCFETTSKETDSSYEGYAVNNETATVENQKSVLSKKQWKPFFKPGDNAISIHIPDDQPLTTELIINSLEEGRDFFRTCFPSIDIKAFICISWLISPTLKSILNPTSNIIGFQDLFVKFPEISQGIEVFNFVFQKSADSLSDIDLDLLPENTTLQKNLKKLYKSGKFIYETGGIFKF